MRKQFVILLTGLLMLVMLGALPARAEDRVVFLYDEGGRLTSEDFTQCQNRLVQAADHTGMKIAVILGSSDRSDYAIEQTVKQTYLDLYGEHSDGLCYYMDLKGSSPYDYIATRGMAQFYYTNSSSNDRVDAMLTAMDKYLYPIGREEVAAAVMAMAEQIEYYYDAGIPSRYYVYDDTYRQYMHVENGKIVYTNSKPYHDAGAIILGFLGGGFLGLIAALITFLAVKSRYRFKYSLEPTAYISQKNVHFKQQYDKFVRAYTHKVHIDTSSGGRSGGGGGGGGHSSGGFGGGGHHR